MDEKQLLQAIGQMMDSKLEPINQRLDTMDQRFDAIDQRLDTMDQRFDAIDQHFAETDQRLTKIEVILENDVNRNIHLLAEGHHDIVGKLKELDTLTEKVSDIQETVDVLKVLTAKK